MTVPASAPLCVIPAHLRTAEDAEALMRCLVSLSVTAPGAGAMVVDDGTPDAELRDAARAMCAELNFSYYVLNGASGFVAAANVGLTRAMLGERDAVVLRGDIELIQPGWLETMLARTDTQGRPAAVVGARIVSTRGRVRHAGWQFSRLARRWSPRFEHAPANLPAALHPFLCPVSSDLMLIRNDTLKTVAMFDAALTAGSADVDLCLRVFDHGDECVYEPAVVAVTGAPDTGRAERRSARAEHADRHLAAKWATADLSPFVQEAL
jgi:GT2 family glycosyltransferase